MKFACLHIDLLNVGLSTKHLQRNTPFPKTSEINTGITILRKKVLSVWSMQVITQTDYLAKRIRTLGLLSVWSICCRPTNIDVSITNATWQSLYLRSRLTNIFHDQQKSGRFGKVISVLNQISRGPFFFFLLLSGIMFTN